MSPIKILVIHDDMSEKDPLIVTLRDEYGENNVIVEKKSSKGLSYINEHLTSKLIVLLDFDLGQGEPHAPEVFEKIRKETSLIYVIIITAKQFSTIDHDDLVNFINNDALGIIQSTADIKDIMHLVKKAAHELDTRVDCVLEQWISKRPTSDKQKPYLTTKSGKTYSLDDLIIEIRKQTNLGKQLEKGILQLAIDQLTNDIERLND